FSNYTPPPEIYTLSLHDALPIFGGEGHPGLHRAACRGVLDLLRRARTRRLGDVDPAPSQRDGHDAGIAPHGSGGIGIMATELEIDRKSTRLNSSHVSISYAVFCL